MSDTTTGSQSDADASKGTEGTNDTSTGDQSASGAAGTSNDTSSGNASNDDATKGTETTISREEFDKLDARMRAADKRASEAEQKSKELEREKLSDQEKVAAELKDVTAERDSLRAEVNDVRLENAFLSINKYSWHDPQDALRLLNTEGVEVKDGKVTGLSEAVDKLAKDKKHLLKTEEDGKGSSAASGSASNGTRKGDKKEPPKNYSSRFPALRSPAKKSDS